MCKVIAQRGCEFLARNLAQRVCDLRRGSSAEGSYRDRASLLSGWVLA